MSAGNFDITFYESTDLGGAIMIAKVQPETLLLFINGTANTAAAGPATIPLRIKVSGGNNEYGVKPRKVTIAFTDQADLPDGYSGEELTIPVMTQAAYAQYTVGSTGTYLGSPVQVISRIPERSR